MNFFRSTTTLKKRLNTQAGHPSEKFCKQREHKQMGQVDAAEDGFGKQRDNSENIERINAFLKPLKKQRSNNTILCTNTNF